MQNDDGENGGYDSHTHRAKNDGNIIELLCGVVTWKLEPMRVGERETQMQEREETTLRRSDDNERYRLFIACDLLATLCKHRVIDHHVILPVVLFAMKREFVRSRHRQQYVPNARIQFSVLDQIIASVIANKR